MEGGFVMTRTEAAPGTRVTPRSDMLLNDEKRHIRAGEHYTVDHTSGSYVYLKEVPWEKPRDLASAIFCT